jgi:hypothetical protein
VYLKQSYAEFEITGFDQNGFPVEISVICSLVFRLNRCCSTETESVIHDPFTSLSRPILTDSIHDTKNIPTVC